MKSANPRFCGRRMLAVAVFLVSPAAAPMAVASDALDAYVSLATGSFDTAAQAAGDSRYDAVTWHIAEVWPGRSDDARWLYAENWIDGSERPYRQRISRISRGEAGTLVARGYRIPDPDRFQGAWRDPARLQALTVDALTPVEGCDVVITRAGERRFEGSTSGHSCRNAYKGASYVLSRSVLTDKARVNWDRGFSADGELVWGPAVGGYRFVRQTDEPRCDKPVRMLVFGEIFDRKKFGAYVGAITSSGLYPRLGGYYEAITPALDVLEGEPPPGRGVVISRFPCLEAARAFWHSPEYADILPLREGVAEFEVLVLPGLPIPDYAQ